MRPLFAILLLCACGSDGGRASMFPSSGICGRYLECVADATPAMLAYAADEFGPDGGCWRRGEVVAPACETACRRELELLQRATGAPACGCRSDEECRYALCDVGRGACLSPSDRFAGRWRTSDGQVTLSCAGEPTRTTPLSRSSFTLEADGPTRVRLPGDCPLTFTVGGRSGALEAETHCLVAGVDETVRAARLDLDGEDVLEVHRLIDESTAIRSCRFVEQWRAQRIQ